jgi:hypothetical protein
MGLVYIKIKNQPYQPFPKFIFIFLYLPSGPKKGETLVIKSGLLTIKNRARRAKIIGKI